MMTYSFFAAVMVGALYLLLKPLYAETRKQLPVLLIATGLTGVVFTLYAIAGSPESVERLKEYQTQQANLAAESMAYLEKLKLSPEDAGLWARLGDNYGKMRDWPKASSALKKAVTLSEGNPAFIQSYAVSLYYEAGEKVTRDARESFDMLLMLDPENETALYFIALYEKQQGEVKKAIDLWQQLLPRLEIDSPLYEHTKEQLRLLGK